MKHFTMKLITSKNSMKMTIHKPKYQSKTNYEYRNFMSFLIISNSKNLNKDFIVDCWPNCFEIFHPLFKKDVNNYLFSYDSIFSKFFTARRYPTVLLLYACSVPLMCVNESISVVTVNVISNCAFIKAYLWIKLRVSTLFTNYCSWFWIAIM